MQLDEVQLTKKEKLILNQCIKYGLAEQYGHFYFCTWKLPCQFKVERAPEEGAGFYCKNPLLYIGDTHEIEKTA